MDLPMTALDLISTPVPLLGPLPVRTRVGISGDDPLAERNPDARFRVFVTHHDGEGRFAGRDELAEIGPGERRLVDVTELAGEPTDLRLSVVHRVPVADCPAPADPATTPTTRRPSEFDLYRTVVQFVRPEAAFASVVYETPPHLNDLRVRPRPASALMFTSMVWLGERTDTQLVALHHSVDPGYDRTASFRLQLFDGSGAPVASTDREVGPFGVATVSLRDLVGPLAGPSAGYSAVAWSDDAALIFLVLQLGEDPPSVAVEHTHPPQTYVLSPEPAVRSRLKERAIRMWEATWPSNA